MSYRPFDPSLQQIATDQNEDTDTFEAQQGYGVEYENGQYRNESADQTQGVMRSGSYEAQNVGKQTASTVDSNADKVRGDVAESSTNQNPQHPA